MLRSTVRATSTRGSGCKSRCFASVAESAGFRVAAVDNGQPTSSVTFLVKAGSRYETRPGVAHALKNFGFKNTIPRSALGTLRQAELYGGLLSAAHTREYISYTADFLRGDEAYFVEVLSNIITSTRFTPHEFDEVVKPSVEAEAMIARADPAIHAIEVAHALAFRSGLGQSLFAPSHSDLALEDIANFATTSFGKGGIAVIGTGISQENLSKLVEKNLASAHSVNPRASKTTGYYGGESRLPFSEHSSHAPHTVLFGFGVPGQSKPELAVLSAYLSPAPSVKWSAGLSPLSTILPQDAWAQTVYLPYSDATFFGLLIQGKTPEVVAGAAKVAIKTIQDTVFAKGVKESDLKRAAAKAKFLAASASEGREGLVSTYGAGLLFGSEFSLDSVFASIDKVQASDINNTLSGVSKSKPTYVAIGDTYKLPHLDELGPSK